MLVLDAGGGTAVGIWSSGIMLVTLSIYDQLPLIISRTCV